MQRIMRRLLPKAAVLNYGLGLLLLIALVPLFWPGLWANLLATGYGLQPFMTHRHCYLEISSLVYLHLSSDLLIGLSYVAISLMLAYLVYRARRDIPFHWVFLAFGLFIIACGGTHFMEVYNTYSATYWLAGYVKLITAVASVATAVVLPPLVPRALKLVQSAKLSEERRLKLEATNQELERLYRKVKEAEELKSQFFANVSHELRTPLALILGPTERVLASAKLTAEERRALEVIDRNARSLLKHVSDLLDMSKLEAGKMKLRYATLDLAQLLRLAVSHFDSAALERHIQLNAETPETMTVKADAEKLERVLLNLLVNALKFTPEGGTVRCRLSDEGERALIEVHDSGPGVPEELRDSIFERFQQGEQGSARRFGGTGLGLSIAREFVELHGGQLNVLDSPEGGALFRISLPRTLPAGTEVEKRATVTTAASDDSEGARQSLEELRAAIASDDEQQGEDGHDAAEPDISPGTSGLRDAPLVLVVEDNPEMSRFIIESLSTSYRTAVASNGREGLERALSLRPDLIISDVMMPLMSGDRMLQELRTNRELDDVPVIVLTAKADDEMRVKLLQSGAQDYLMKPFSVAELQARIGNLMTMKRARSLLQQELASRSHDLEELAQHLMARRAEQDRMLSALRESEERYRYLAEAMPQIVWTADSEGSIDYYNSRWFEYTGMTMERTKGWGWQPVLHPDDAERAVRRWARCVLTGEPYQVEYRFRRGSDGQFRWHLGRAVPMHDADGRIVRWFGTSTDIHDQKRAAEVARESSRAKDNFLATLSHELRTPLTPIIGWVHMMRNGIIPVSEFEHSLAIIDKNSHALMRLINDLLDMSAIMSGKMRIESLPLHLHSALREAIETIRPEAEKRHIRIETTNCDDEHSIVLGDRTRLVQSFWNLLSNAVKFSPAESRVRVSCESNGTEQRIVIEDEGQGIRPDFLPKVFERFRQADESKTREHGGLGIGLALVKSFIESHAGRVTAESEGVGRGSRFTVYLPRYDAEATTEPDVLMAEKSEAKAVEGDAHLLLVEDAEDTLSLLETALEMRGYRTTACSSAAEALEVAAETEFDLIISDIGLPQMDGHLLLQKLREMPHLQNVPAIALTGYASQKDADAALAAGFDRHLAKPIEPLELVAEVGRLLRPDEE